MKSMSIAQIAEACNGKLYFVNTFITKEAAGVVVDSRKVEKDYLFIATVGERVDGHDYIDSAFEKGALAAICEKLPTAPSGPCILVEDSFAALKDIAKWYRLQLTIKVIGITGSVGKTSTKEFISSVLARKYNVLKTEGNFNNEIGLPLTILRLREEHEVAVLEMGINNFGEMRRLSEIAKPDICVITNIGQCHLENLGSRQGILKAKTEIFDFLSDSGRVCINGDDDMLATLKEVKGYLPIRFGISTCNEIYADHIRATGLFGSTCDIHFGDEIIHTKIPLPGEHMILNALAATSVATLLGLTSKEIVTGIATVKPLGGRSNIIRLDKWTLIDDCYNANPVSMKAAIDLLRMADTRKVAILGDMGELGGNEKALHTQIGTYAADSGLDLLICVGKLSASMYEGAANSPLYSRNETTVDSSYPRLYYYETREELLDHLSSLVAQNDTILVKASHFMGFDQIVNALQ
jgi:UDP-N-acetylmuramoyl-tripeptide--D-alanyl-D-alanine ligase